MGKNDRSSINPFTGKKHFNIVNDDKFLDRSYAEYDNIINQSELLDETPDGQLIADVSLKLIDAVEKYLSEINRADYTKNYYDWEFHLVSNDVVNAFCMPGGKILMYSGILSIANTEEYLAFILAHEMAHALLDHSRTQASAHTAKNTATIAGKLGGIGLDLVGLGDAANVVTTATNVADIGSEYLLLKPWGRDQELEADELGMKIINWAGYDISGIPQFWQRMSENNSNKHDFFSTHPSDKKRIDAMNKLVLELSNQGTVKDKNPSKQENKENTFHQEKSEEKKVEKTELQEEKEINELGIENNFKAKGNKFCSKCGEELGKKDVFCPSCGNKIQKDTEQKVLIGKSNFGTISLVLGIIGVILGFIGAIRALMFISFSAELIVNAGIALVASLLGLVAIWLSNKDYRIAFAEYLIAAAGLIIGIYLIGILGAIFFIIAAIFLFIDKRSHVNGVEA